MGVIQHPYQGAALPLSHNGIAGAEEERVEPLKGFPRALKPRAPFSWPAMKKEITSFDLRRLMLELAEVQGGYLDKVYQEGDRFTLRFHVPGRGRREVFHQVGRWLALAPPAEKPEAPEPFAAALRKALPNPRVEALEQRGFDRIAIVRMRQGEEEYRLILEIFGRGNVVLTRGETIVHAFRPQVFRSRDLRPGASYAFPPGGLDPLPMDAASLAQHLGDSKKPLVKALATDFNLGGLYAEEVCLRAGVDKGSRASALGDMEKGSLHRALQDLAAEALRGPAGQVLQAGVAIDVLPCPLQVYRGAEFRGFPSLSEALMDYIAKLPDEVPEEESLARLRRRLEQQEESLRTLGAEEALSGETADYLYAHYQEVSAALQAVREGQDTGGLGSVDREKGTAVIDLGNGHTVALDFRRNVEENARGFYQRRKEARDKAVRVEEALAETRRALEQAGARARRSSEKKPTAKPTKRFWFEAYRWFFSSEGFLGLGGRDASSNDKLVRRHLKEGDRYAHADIQGAPSVVTKEGSRAGEATLREACHFSLLNSKAWAAGLASGSAYWVLPEQVSKQAESGEYLKSGSFVIRGRRNYFHDLPLEAGVGEIEHEGHRKIMGGPTSALEARSRHWVILRPAQGSRGDLARELAAAFEVPVEEVQRVLPPGASDVVRWMQPGGGSVTVQKSKR